MVVRNVPLPLLENGDWVLFPCMGAYTMAAGSDFNGFNITEVCARVVGGGSMVKAPPPWLDPTAAHSHVAC